MTSWHTRTQVFRSADRNKAGVKLSLPGVGDTANFGIDPIPSKYRASIAHTDTDTFNLKIPDQIMILYFCL